MVKKITVRKRRKFNFSKLVTVIALFAISTTFASKIFVRTINQRISNEVQSIQHQISEKQVANEVLRKEISDLRNVDRVVAIAQEAGLEATDSAVTIKGD